MPILVKIRNSRAEWKEYLERMDRYRIPKAAMQCKTKGKRDRENPEKDGLRPEQVYSFHP